MQTQDPNSEVSVLQTRLDTAKKRFYVAMEQDIEFGELKPLYREINELERRIAAIKSLSQA